MLAAVSEKAGAGREKTFCRIDCWQSEVDEWLIHSVRAQGKRRCWQLRLSYSGSAMQAYDRQMSSPGDRG